MPVGFVTNFVHSCSLYIVRAYCVHRKKHDLYLVKAQNMLFCLVEVPFDKCLLIMLKENVLDSLPKEIFSSQLIFNIISRYQDKTKKNSDDA